MKTDTHSGRGDVAGRVRPSAARRSPAIPVAVALTLCVATHLAAQDKSPPTRLVAAPAIGSPAVAAPAVGQWGRFELSVVNATPYKDPFRDVTLDVTYTRPDGASVRCWGFYDGDSTWRARLMPDRIGPWKYDARFSDGSPGAAGGFECIASGLPGMVTLDETNPMWFGYQGGGHLLVRALHVGDRFFAAEWPEADRRRFLQWTAGQGYNTLSIASHYLRRNEAGRGAEWETPDLWPLDPGEYRRMEVILDELAARRMLVFPFAGFFGRSSDFPLDPRDQELYVRYTLARIGCYWNLLFNVGGPEPLLENRPYLTISEANRLGRLIGGLDVYHHPLTIHNRTGDDQFRDSDWLTFGTLQGPKTSSLDRLSRGLRENHHPRKALLAQETLWSGNVNHIRALGGRDYTDEELRSNAWVIHMSAAAMVFADNGGGNSSAGFSGSLDPADAARDRHEIVRRVWDIAVRFPYYEMSPRQDLVDRGYCLAAPGRCYLVYLPSAGAVNVKIAGGPYRVEWINARQGDDRRPGGTTADG
ncbi:MAG: DUF5060 domain-containing protein, partial [Thermoguttaceae bacterium]